MPNVLFIPITKVDMQKREVYGRATQEVLDGHDEIMDYASSAPLFAKWSEEMFKRSGGKSKGNIREMHQPIAAGKVIDISFNQAEKAIDIGTYVSDDSSWKKVCDGVLTGFSIGGDYAKRWMDGNKPGVTRYTADPHEISLVDMPAVPTATFELIRADGVSELRKFASSNLPAEIEKIENPVSQNIEEISTEGDVNKNHQGAPGIPAEDVPIEMGSTEGARIPDENVPEEVLSGAIVAEISKTGDNVPALALNNVREISPVTANVNPVDSNDGGEPEWMENFRKTATQFSKDIESKMKIETERTDIIKKSLAELKLRSSRVGIDRRESEPLTALNGYPQDWTMYGDPVNWKFPVTKELAKSSLLAYNAQAFVKQYTPREWNIVGRRLARLASSTFGGTYKFDSASKKVEFIKEKIIMTDLNKEGSAMDLLRSCQAQMSAAMEMVGTDPAAAKDLLMQVMASMDIAGNMSAASPASGASPSLGSASASVANAAPAEPLAAPVTPALVAEKVDAPVVAVSTPVDVQKAFAEALSPVLDMVKTLQATVTQLQKQQDNPTIDPPAGDLNSIVPELNEDTNPLLKAMNEGNLRKAYEAVGNDPMRLNREITDMAVKQIAMTGINVSKYGIFPSVEPIFSEPVKK